MAFLREYKLFEELNVLVKYFYYDNRDAQPSMIIRFDLNNHGFSVIIRRYYLSQTIVLDEIRRMYALLDDPHWKSFVNITSPDHRFRQDELFVPDHY